jgi:hypothetical protein
MGTRLSRKKVLRASQLPPLLRTVRAIGFTSRPAGHCRVHSSALPAASWRSAGRRQLLVPFAGLAAAPAHHGRFGLGCRGRPAQPRPACHPGLSASEDQPGRRRTGTDVRPVWTPVCPGTAGAARETSQFMLSHQPPRPGSDGLPLWRWSCAAAPRNPCWLMDIHSQWGQGCG